MHYTDIHKLQGNTYMISMRLGCYRGFEK